MMNIFLGFEQANRYVILNPQGEHIGYMAEHDGGFAKTMGRQWFRTHRAFTTNVFNRSGQEVLRFHRPFSWINTRIKVFDPVELNTNLQTSTATELQTDVLPEQRLSGLKTEEMRVVGEVQSEWAPLRRKYDLFLAGEQQGKDKFQQFARIDERFLSWDFSLRDNQDRLIGSVNRNWVGLAKEMFADAGMYALRMDAAGLEEEAGNEHLVSQSHRGEKAYDQVLGEKSDGMTFDQRAVMLATAVNIDFDYFSRKSNSGGLVDMPLWMMMGGRGEAAGTGAGAGAAEVGTAGAIGETVSTGGAVGRGVAGVGAGEGAIAGAGSMAGYEAMQRGMGRDEASPQAPSADASPYGDGQPPNASDAGQSQGQGQDVWGSGDSDPWAENPSTGDGEGSGGVGSSLWDAFFGDE